MATRPTLMSHLLRARRPHPEPPSQLRLRLRGPSSRERRAAQGRVRGGAAGQKRQGGRRDAGAERGPDARADGVRRLVGSTARAWCATSTGGPPTGAGTRCATNQISRCRSGHLSETGVTGTWTALRRTLIAP